MINKNNKIWNKYEQQVTVQSTVKADTVYYTVSTIKILTTQYKSNKNTSGKRV